MFDHLLDLVAPLIGVEKSPETVNGEEQLHRALAAYPGARFIHLARHPVTAERSLQVRWMTFNRPEVYALSWLNQHRRIAEFCAELPPEQWILVRSEDVLNSSTSELRRIAHWLGVRDDDQAVEAMCHPERSPYASPGFDGPRSEGTTRSSSRTGATASRAASDTRPSAGVEAARRPGRRGRCARDLARLSRFRSAPVQRSRRNTLSPPRGERRGERMSREAAQAFVERLNDDDAFRETMIAADDNAARLRTAQEAGFDITADDLDELRREHSVDELSEEDLQRIAGAGAPPRW